MIKKYLTKFPKKYRKWLRINLKELSEDDFKKFSEDMTKYESTWKYKLSIFLYYKIPKYLENIKRKKLLKQIDKFNKDNPFIEWDKSKIIYSSHYDLRSCELSEIYFNRC